jgi:hypothetical protein
MRALRESKRDIADLNKAMSCVFLALGSASVAVPASSQPEPQPWHSWIIFSVAVLIFSVTWVWMFFRSYGRREHYVTFFKKRQANRGSAGRPPVEPYPR